MSFLFLFLDGVGLGPNDPATNPLAAADMPNLQHLLGGQPLVAETAPFFGPRATLLSLDANLGVTGFPQSATGQAALITGRNVPAEIGGHFGPKPNAAITEILHNGNLFKTIRQAGKSAALLNAYPPRYFEGILSGKRIYSSIPMAVTSGGLTLKTEDDLYDGDGMSADFTGEAWREHLGYTDSPIISPQEAGHTLARLSHSCDLAFFEFWISDYIGHYQDMDGALRMLTHFDAVLGSLIGAWNDDEGLILLTSDHGNLEDLTTRRHTKNRVPGLIIGSEAHRRDFARGLRDLTGITPAILRFLGI